RLENPELPDLREGETLKLHSIEPKQHFTQPPPRFTEASLVKTLEELGIGRPSTYASIMSVIQEKEYVKKVEGRFFPSDLGKLVNGLLVESFPDILDVGFTAQMEEELDEVEEGKRKWVTALKDFYRRFEKTLNTAKHEMRDVKREAKVTNLTCEKCGSPMVIKWGRHGEFLACQAYPECRNTKEFKRTDSDKIEVVEKKQTDEKCEKCGSPMVVKRGRFGEFLACSKYPECKTTKSIGTGIKCPECTKGELVQRRSKRGRSFYSCNRYPDCRYAIWDKPVLGPCPDCGHALLVEKYSKKSGGRSIACPKKECGYKKEIVEG
ncbi:MAG: topoisomerase DNA-binding C4 zinc finger domain-containing protein, partial [Deltaproteobacteria bacterium]|nr:topoisomerase DNA-binding C4 zinc finger domain-containing protein [Deltaproteobacteria bacterium]